MGNRLLYVSFFREDSESIGFKNKVYAQCSAFRNAGFEVYLASARSDCLMLYKVDEEKRVVPKKEFIHSAGSVHKETGSRMSILLRKIRRHREIVSFLYEIVRVTEADVMYMRRPRLSGDLVRFVRRTSEDIPILYEFPTWPWEREFIATKGTIPFVYEWLCMKLVKKKLTALVKVQAGDFDGDGLFIRNGVSVESVPLRRLPQCDPENELHLLGVATLANWHGYDRLLKGIAEYRRTTGNTGVHFHIVGDGSEKKPLEQMSHALGIQRQVVFYGSRTGKELDDLFSKCHIAVGSLGVHRKGLSQTSELKAREYCARGIPFICSVPDADFPAGFPYVLRVNSSEEPVDVEQIISFARTICSKDDHPNEMREYAMNNLDWSIKMKKLVEFLRGILQNKGDR